MQKQTEQFVANSMLLWWTLESVLLPLVITKESSEMQIRAASASAKLHQSGQTRKRIELSTQLL